MIKTSKLEPNNSIKSYQIHHETYTTKKLIQQKKITYNKRIAKLNLNRREDDENSSNNKIQFRTA